MGHSAKKENSTDSIIAIAAVGLLGYLFFKWRSTQDLERNPGRGRAEKYAGVRTSLSYVDAVHAAIVPRPRK